MGIFPNATTVLVRVKTVAIASFRETTDNTNGAVCSIIIVAIKVIIVAAMFLWWSAAVLQTKVIQHVTCTIAFIGVATYIPTHEPDSIVTIVSVLSTVVFLNFDI